MNKKHWPVKLNVEVTLSLKGANLLLRETPRCTVFSDFMNPDGEILAWLELLGTTVHQNHDSSVRIPLWLLVTPHAAACAAVLQVWFCPGHFFCLLESPRVSQPIDLFLMDHWRNWRSFSPLWGFGGEEREGLLEAGFSKVVLRCTIR